MFSKKGFKNFLTPKKLKNWPQKLLIIGPFILQSSPDHSPQPRIDFSYYEILGPDMCSLICGIISEENFDVSQNTNENISKNSALASKKWFKKKMKTLYYNNWRHFLTHPTCGHFNKMILPIFRSISFRMTSKNNESM